MGSTGIDLRKETLSREECELGGNGHFETLISLAAIVLMAHRNRGRPKFRPILIQLSNQLVFFRKKQNKTK